MAESLEDRLRSHAKAFDGLLQLIPADIYYGKDTSLSRMQNQWQRKKQTKEQARAAKLAKLDPDNSKSAKDVMDENARKRKREEDAVMAEGDGMETEKPQEGLRNTKPTAKKQKKEEKKALEQVPTKIDGQLPIDVDVTKAKAEKRKEKRERRKAKEEARTVKLKARKARKLQETALVEDARADLPIGSPSDFNGDGESAGIHLEPLDISGMTDSNEAPPVSDSTATPSPTPQSPIYDASTAKSGTSSISSIAPPTIPASKDRIYHKILTIPQTNPEELKARLQQRIESLRAARKADTADGTPARNRQELMEARRRKEEQRKAQKKELRLKAREEELRQRDLALARGSPLLSPAVMSPTPGTNALPSSLGNHIESSNNFSFGRIAFENGQVMTANLNAVIDPHKRKGPQDPLTALQAVNNRTERISALDPNKRADIEEKDSWLNARKRAHGERIRDDSSLLKKTLKRKEKAKKKSEKEWGERIEGIEKGKAMKQKKREENLQKRKDEKGGKGKKAKSKSKSKGAKKGKPKARPGFEGSFRAGGKK
ncbi:hypothetical protein MMC11_002502 [Xylographa trunciseda]|nr:hypothetical protein [Xylographa trunciseda]